MTPGKKQTALLLGAIGGLLVATYFWVADNSRVASLLTHHTSKSEILAKAETAFSASPLMEYELSKEIELNVNEELLRYAQTYLEQEAFLPIGRWEISWSGEIPAKKEGPQEVGFSVSYDFRGNLLAMNLSDPSLNRPPNFKESEALNAAKSFMGTLGVDTSAVALRNKIISEEDRTLRYDFLFSRPSPVTSHLRENYDIRIAGRNIISYEARTDIDPDTFAFPESERSFRTPLLITSVVSWCLLSILLIAVFFKRLRHDLLEFKRGVWLGLTAFLLTWAHVLFEGWPNLETVLLGGGLSGIFVGIGALMAYSVAESLNREIWPQRVALTDALCRAAFRVRELGATLLAALFMAGATLFVFALLFLITGELKIGHLSFDEELLWIFKNEAGLISNLFQSLVASFFITIVLFAFWLTYLKSKIRSHAVLILLVGISVNLAGLHFYLLRPSHLSFLVFLPVGILWAYFVLKFDFVSVLLSVFMVEFFLELPLIGLLPNGFISAPGLTVIGLVLLMFVSGAYWVNSDVSVKDFRRYVPPYVARISERERFLKELEIARSVQTRFLPQAVPQFPRLDIATICTPAREVGGDYYDFISNGSDSLGVILGDVSGKGVSAAFYMTMVKGIVKTLTKSKLAPKEILTEMNAIFYENAPRDVFISMVYGLFDIRRACLTFARAGHNPIIVRKSSVQKLEMLQSKGLAIGLDGGQIFSTTIEELTINIEPGDVFVFFTDGITESMDKNGEEFGEQRLQKIINDNSNLTAHEILHRITRTLSRFSGRTPQHDDLTMVVVKVLPEEQPAAVH